MLIKAEYTYKCEDCGKEWVAFNNHGTKVRCKECQEIHRRNYYRRNKKENNYQRGVNDMARLLVNDIDTIVEMTTKVGLKNYLKAKAQELKNEN